MIYAIHDLYRKNLNMHNNYHCFKSGMLVFIVSADAWKYFDGK